MLFMRVAHFKNANPLPIDRRFRDRGRMAPTGAAIANRYTLAGSGLPPNRQFGDTRCPVSKCSACSATLPKGLGQEFGVSASLIDELRG